MNAMKRPILTMPAILLLLALLIVAPVILMGYQNERNARIALDTGGQPDYFAKQFELAARRIPWKPELWNEAAEGYFRASNWWKMRDALEHARTEKVLTACNFRMLAFDYFVKDPWRGDEFVLQIFFEGIEQYPENFLLYDDVASIYEYKERYDEALQYLLLALDHKENAYLCDGRAFAIEDTHYRAGVLLMQDDPTRALDELNTASSLDDEYAPVVETLRTTLNLAALEDDPAEKLILIGRGLGLVDEWQLAASVFHDATQADPENASAWAWLGTAKDQFGEDALSAFEMAESINPNDIELLSLRAVYWQRHVALESAQADFEKLVALEPENPQWRYALGGVYAELGDLPTALAAYEKAIALAPTEPLYVNALALFSFNYRYDMAGIGLPAARRAVILAPQDAQYIDTLGLLYLGMEEFDDAEKQFLRALEKDPLYRLAELHLGMAYLGRGDWSLARTALINAEAFADDEAVRMQARRLLDEYFPE